VRIISLCCCLLCSSEHAKSIRPNRTTAEKCSRTFITFSDEVLYRQCFPSRRKLRSIDKSTCPVTGLPAKYFDPLTRIPYATTEAFKVIRQSFQRDTDVDITQTRHSASRELCWVTAVINTLLHFCSKVAVFLLINSLLEKLPNNSMLLKLQGGPEKNAVLHTITFEPLAVESRCLHQNA